MQRHSIIWWEYFFFSSVCGPRHMYTEKQSTIFFVVCIPDQTHTEKQYTISDFFYTPGHMHTERWQTIFVFFCNPDHKHTERWQAFFSPCTPGHTHTEKWQTILFISCSPGHKHTESWQPISVFSCTPCLFDTLISGILSVFHEIPGHVHTEKWHTVSFFPRTPDHTHTFWLHTFFIDFCRSLSRQVWMFAPLFCLFCAKLFAVAVNLLRTDFQFCWFDQLHQPSDLISVLFLQSCFG